MKKNALCEWLARGSNRLVTKHLLVMKITIVLLTAAFLNVHAAGFSQDITFSGENVPLQKVLNAIEKQTGYVFLYSESVLAKSKPVSIKVTGLQLKDFLDHLFRDQPIKYEIGRKSIFLSPKSNTRAIIPAVVPIPERLAPPPLKGIVRSVDGIPLAGATILLKRSSQSITAAEDGSFSIVAEAGDVLVVSYIGYETREVPITQETLRSMAVISLKAQAGEMSEMVVIGYGIQSKKDVTSAVSQVKGKEIHNLPVVSPTALLQGRAAGVQITTNSGAPGATDMTIRVRGTTSISAGNDPLFVVDGMQLAGNPSTINPNDIESIEIFKDAAATAIYGSRGANGVVLITTKRGKSGAPVYGFNHYSSIQLADRSRLPQMLNADEFIELIQEQRANSGLSSLYNFIYPDQVGSHNNTNWTDAVLQTGRMSNYEVSIRGGEEKIKFYFSAGLLDQKGILINSDFKRITSKLNLDYTASKRLKIGTNLNMSGVSGNDLNVEQAFKPTLWKAPVFPIYNNDGSYYLDGDVSGTNNPIARAMLVSNEMRSYRLFGDIFAELEITKGLSLRTSMGIDVVTRKDDMFSPSNSYRNGITTGSYSNSLTYNWLNEYTLNYIKTIKDHRVTALMGYSRLQNTNEQSSAAGRDFATNNIRTLNAASTITSANSSKGSYGMESFFSRLGYTFADKYILQTSLRSDGSSRFGKDNRYALFPSLSLGWRVAQEQFFEPLSDVLNDLKIRTSYGRTGNQNGIGNYTAQGLYATGIDYLNQPGIGISVMPNNNLKWETTDQFNAGLDLVFLHSRIRLSVDVYLKNTSNLLLSVPLPASTGFSAALQNIGQTSNKGLELDLNTVNVKSKDFTWTTNVNISFNRNRIVKLYEGKDIIASRGSTGYGSTLSQFILREGQPIGLFYGWESLGVYARSSDNNTGLRNNTAAGYLFKGGDIHFNDLNGDNVINDEDRIVIGSALPKYTGGITNNISYANFELNTLGQFTYGNDVYNGMRAVSEAMIGFQNGTKNLLNRWRKEGDITDVPRAVNDDLAMGMNKRSSTRWIEDGSYFRIKTVTLAYNLPGRALSGLKITGVRIYATAQNLYTFTKYSGIDPESSYQNTAVYDLGFDYANYPQYRSWLIGINVNF